MHWLDELSLHAKQTARLTTADTCTTATVLHLHCVHWQLLPQIMCEIGSILHAVYQCPLLRHYRLFSSCINAGKLSCVRCTNCSGFGSLDGQCSLWTGQCCR
jgi:hypothetical protein